MRIAIITFFQSKDNYGQLLQCYALQRVLRRLGHSPYLIRYGFHQKYFHWLKKSNFITRQGRIRTLKRIKEIFRHMNTPNDRGFDSFRRKHLIQSYRCYNSLSELQRRPPKAACYITGSDQVWAQLLSKIDNRSFFLDFGPESVKRLSYAPSFAVNDYPQELKIVLSEQLKKFNAISVRESSGVKICNSIGYDAKLVLDPTLLLSASDYRRLMRIPTTSKYSFVYQINVTSKEELFWDDVTTYNKKKGLRSIATFANAVDEINMEFLLGAEYVYPSIPYWLGYLFNAEYVLTSSFHGVVFSILFHKPFLVCLRKESMFAGNDRILTLLNELSLSDRVVGSGYEIEPLLSKRIDWITVDKLLSKLQTESLTFLTHNLN